MRRSRCCSRWLFSTFQLSGVASQRTFKNRITLLLQYCQGKKREREKQRNANVRVLASTSRTRSGTTTRKESTSEVEYEGDASAL